MISRTFLLVLFALLVSTGAVHAQQYRWVDKDGRVQFTDTPPPAWAKEVRKTEGASEKPAAAPLPFELARLQQDFPVTLYTAPTCKEGCDRARTLLNRRGIPFKEVSVVDNDSQDELKRVSGGTDVPVMVVGRSVERGFEQSAFDAVLDSAGYPKAGIYPARSQKAPDATGVKAQKVEAPKKTGPYDPSGLQGTPQKPGPYGVPGEDK